MSFPSLDDFATQLLMALEAADAEQRVRDLLRQIIVSDFLPWEGEEAGVVRALAARVDVGDTDPDRLLAITSDLACLARHASSASSVEQLVEIFAERKRLLDVARKYLKGIISRTSFLSYVSTQRWPNQVKRAVEAFSDDEVFALTEELQSRNVASIERLLL